MLLGVILSGGGAYLVIEGVAVRDELRDELRVEQIITSDDADPPGVLVEDARTARAQADVIKEHTLGPWGPYSELPRDDPRRASFIDGVALRSSLSMAAMGFRITDLVIGMGLLVALGGLATLFLATPGLYLLAGMVSAREH